MIRKLSIIQVQCLQQLMQSNNYPNIPEPQTRPVSSYLGKDNSLLEQALAHLPGTLPQAATKLQSNLHCIPGHMMSPNMYKEIHAYNRKLVQDQFVYLCDNVGEIYGKTAKIGQQGIGPFLEQVKQLLLGWLPDGAFYVTKLDSEAGLLMQAGNQGDFLRALLRNLALSHAEYFQLNTGAGGNFMLTNHNENRIPQKYLEIIQTKIASITQPTQPNYFQHLIMDPILKQQSNKTQEQIQADAAANFLTDMFNQRRNVDAKQITERQKGFKPTSSTINFVPFEVTYGKKAPTTTSPIDNPQHLLNDLILSIQAQQQNNSRTLYPQIEFENWFTNTFSQMTYYESYMMAHMADLIFLHPEKFEIKYLKFQPYLGQLQRQVQEEIASVKSEEAAFQVLMQSRYRYVAGQESNNMQAFQAKQRKCSEDLQKSKQGNKIIDKAKYVLKDLYKKAKQQLSGPKQKPKQSLNASFDSKKYLQENQNLLLPSQSHPEKSLKTLLRDMQNLNNLLTNLHQLQAQSHTHGGLFNSIRQFAEELKHKIYDESPYYHEVQSWMAVVMLLYKELAMDPDANFHYSPSKRRCIIRVCKRIFIQESKEHNDKIKDKSKLKNKDKKSENGFQNWPVLLKFLQNNRPQILLDAQGSTNQKQVDRILHQLYSVIGQKKLLGSSFGNLFQGIQNIKESIPQIKLTCLSSGSNPSQNLNKGKTTTQCKVVHILVSGFLSEDTSKLEEWADMVETMSDSEVYALVWESSTIKNLVKFFLKSAADVVGAAKMIDQIRRKYTDNPFNPAFQVAQITGRILAQLVIRLFPNKFVNICGYSLGSEVIKQFLHRMVTKNKCHLINNIYLLGGVSDSLAFADLISRSEVPLSVYNCYTNNDAVLKHLLSLCKPDIRPIGLNNIKKVQGHSVINVDCTKFISGHLAFRSNLRLMGEILELSTG